MPRQRALTKSQEAYAVERARGQNQQEAYSTAYPKSQASSATKFKEGQRLEHNPAIAQRIATLKVKVQDEVETAVVKDLALDKTIIIAELWENAQQAKAAIEVKDHKGRPTGVFNANWQASNAALALIGKEIGMFRDAPKKQDPLSDLTHEQLLALRDLAQEVADGHAAESAGATGKPGPKRGQRTTH